jgi:hypothetical protein
VCDILSFFEVLVPKPEIGNYTDIVVLSGLWHCVRLVEPHMSQVILLF